jgi:hypothetical protein
MTDRIWHRRDIGLRRLRGQRRALRMQGHIVREAPTDAPDLPHGWRGHIPAIEAGRVDAGSL